MFLPLKRPNRQKRNRILRSLALLCSDNPSTQNTRNHTRSHSRCLHLEYLLPFTSSSQLDIYTCQTPVASHHFSYRTSRQAVSCCQAVRSESAATTSIRAASHSSSAKPHGPAQPHILLRSFAPSFLPFLEISQSRLSYTTPLCLFFRALHRLPSSYHSVSPTSLSLHFQAAVSAALIRLRHLAASQPAIKPSILRFMLHRISTFRFFLPSHASPRHL